MVLLQNGFELYGKEVSSGLREILLAYLRYGVEHRSIGGML